MRTHIMNKTRIAAVAGLVATALFGGIPAAHADTTGDDAQPFDPNQAGLVQLYGDPDPGVAQAPQLMNWSSHLTGVLTGFESRHWKDSQYSQVWLKGCSSTGSGTHSTHVNLKWRRDMLPNKSWGVKRYTNCFKSSGSASSGQWHNLESGNHYFRIDKINDSMSGSRLSANKVYIDTSAADS